MNFIYPSFLWALAALSIPVIIHLFNFRRFKKIYFTNVQLLKDVKEQTSSRRNIKHWLVLISRLLALAALVFAFAQPYLPTAQSNAVQGNRAVSVYIDNSFSMNALSNDVSLLEKAKQKATEIANAYAEEDQFQIITNNFEGKHQRLLTKEEFLAAINEIEPSPATQKISAVVERQKQALEFANTAQKNVFLLSDFQKNITDFKNDTAYNFYVLPLQAAEQQNLFIDSVWFNSPVRMQNEANQLLVRIENNGEKDATNSRLTLQINGQVKALKDFTVAAHKTITDTLKFTTTEAGWQQAEAIITDYPISFDDSYYFAFDIAKQYSVLAINQNSPNQHLNALFSAAHTFAFQNQSVGQLDYQKLPTYQLLILNQLREIPSGLSTELQQYLKNGGSVAVFPDDNINLESYNQFFRAVGANTFTQLNTNEQQIDFINTQEEIFKDVFQKIPTNLDLPFVKKSYNTTNFSNSTAEPILQFRQGGTNIAKYKVQAGRLYVSNASLNPQTTNLTSHAIFVPLIYKMAALGGKNFQLAYTIGGKKWIETPNPTTTKESVFKLKNQKTELIPEQKTIGNNILIQAGTQLKDAGVYELVNSNAKTAAFIGFNYNRLESVLEYFNLTELKNLFNFENIKFIDNLNSSITEMVGQLDKGIILWKWCLIACLLFLLFEIILLRFFK